MFDIVASALILADEKGNVILANHAALILFSYSHEDICKLKVEALMPAYHRKHHEAHRNLYIQNPEKPSMSNGRSLSILRSDGKELSVDISLTPLKTEEHLYTLATFGPADRRKAAEEAFRVSEERLKLATQAADSAIFDLDSDNNFLHWDECMGILWGAETAELVSNTKYSTAIHPDDRKSRQTALDAAKDPTSGGEYSTEYRVVNPKDGSERWVSAVGRAHFENGHAVRLIGMARDITEQKNNVEKIQVQRHESEMVNKQEVAAQMISAIAHEINQPITAISVYSEVALRAMKDSDTSPVHLQRALEGCVQQAQRAGKSMHELLTFLHKTHLITEPFDLNQTVIEGLNIAKEDG